MTNRWDDDRRSPEPGGLESAEPWTKLDPQAGGAPAQQAWGEVPDETSWMPAPEGAAAEAGGAAAVPTADPAAPARPGIGERIVAGSKRTVVVIGVVAAIVLATLLGWFLFGEWWINVIRARVDGHVFAGVWFGLLVGVVCTVLTIRFLKLLAYRSMPTAGRFTFGLLAAVALSPLVFSLRVALNPDHNYAKRIQIDGPGYQVWLTIGVVLGGLIYVGSWLLYRKWRRRRDEKKALKAKAREEARQAKDSARQAKEQAKIDAQQAKEQAKQDARRAKDER